MRIDKPPYLWLKGLLAAGLFLSLLLLVESAFTYYHVSRQLVSDQLAREAERQALAVDRGLRLSEASSAGQQRIVLEEILQENLTKIAWMRIIEPTGKTAVEVGEPAGPPLAAGDASVVPAERERIPELRDAPNGKVMVSLVPLRRGRFRPGVDAAPSGLGPPAASQSLEAGRSEIRPPAVRQRPRLLEIALYLESASTVFSPLRRNLVVSILAALGLAAAMIIIWVQLPRYVRGKQLEEQLELARKVQADLLPPSNAALGGLDFAAACVPAWQVGGDFYDVFPTSENHVAFVLGDVSGKGLSAALLMGMLHGALRSMRWMGTPTDQEISWSQLNYLLSTRTGPERFASLFWASYDREARIIRYVNAGHPPPLLMRRNGDGTCKTDRLQEGGPVLGLIRTATYHQGEVPVQPGDLLVLYSDGISEAANTSAEEFGEERLRGVVRENWARPPSEILSEVLKQVRAFIQKAPPQDDMTLVIARVN